MCRAVFEAAIYQKNYVGLKIAKSFEYALAQHGI